jgi:cell division protein FtsB
MSSASATAQRKMIRRIVAIADGFRAEQRASVDARHAKVADLADLRQRMRDFENRRPPGAPTIQYSRHHEELRARAVELEEDIRLLEHSQAALDEDRRQAYGVEEEVLRAAGLTRYMELSGFFEVSL